MRRSRAGGQKTPVYSTLSSPAAAPSPRVGEEQEDRQRAGAERRVPSLSTRQGDVGARPPRRGAASTAGTQSDRTCHGGARPRPVKIRVGPGSDPSLGRERRLRSGEPCSSASRYASPRPGGATARPERQRQRQSPPPPRARRSPSLRFCRSHRTACVLAVGKRLHFACTDAFGQPTWATATAVPTGGAARASAAATRAGKKKAG